MNIAILDKDQKTEFASSKSSSDLNVISKQHENEKDALKLPVQNDLHLKAQAIEQQEESPKECESTHYLEEIEYIDKLYWSLDIDGNGTLSFDEIKQVLQQKFPYDSEYIYSLLLKADTDGSGEIDYEEFVAALQGQNLFRKNMKDGAKIRIINELWQKYDTDLSGELNYKEAKKFIKNTIGGVVDQEF